MNVRKLFLTYMLLGIVMLLQGGELKNSDFAFGLSDWKRAHWDPAEMTPVIDTHDAPDGLKASVRFDLKPQGRALLGQLLSTNGKKFKYKLSLWIKAKNLKDCFAYASTESKGEKNKYLSWKTWINTGFINGDLNWKKYSTEITLPPNTKKFLIWFGVKGKNKKLTQNGKVWFAGIKLQSVIDQNDTIKIGQFRPAENMGIFAPKIAPSLNFNIVNHYAEKKNIHFKISVQDFHGKEVYVKTAKTEIAPLSEKNQKIVIPKISKAGFYGVHLNVYSDQNFLKKMISSFCVIKANPDGNDPFFGLSCFAIPQEKNKIKMLSDIGVGSVGVLFNWSYTESKKGKFKFGPFDKMISDYQSQGIKTIGFTFPLARKGFAPKWALKLIEDYKKTIPPNTFPYPDIYFDNLAEFIRTVVTRYKNKIDTWSLVQEIDLSMKAYKWEYEYYVKEIKTLYKVIKKVSPNSIIGSIGVSSNDCHSSPRFPVARKLWKELPFLDAMFFNAYMGARTFGPGHTPTTPEKGNLRGILQDAEKLVREYGRKRIGIHEKGMKVISSLPPDAPDAKKLARFLVRSYTIAKSLPFVSEYLWYKTWGGYEGSSDYGLWKWNRKKGILMPRPSVAAYSTVANFLSHTENPMIVKLHKDIHIYLFRKTTRKETVGVIWTINKTPILLTYNNPEQSTTFSIMNNPLKTLKRGEQQLTLTDEPFFMTTSADLQTLNKAFTKAEYILPLVKGNIQIVSQNKIKLELYNQSDKVIKPEIILDSKQFKLKSDVTRIKLSPGGKADICFTLKNGFLKDFKDKNIQFTVKAKGVATKIRKKLDFFPVHYITSATQKEFAKLPAIKMNSSDFLFPPDAEANKLWTGTADLSVDTKVGYNASGLFLRFVVKDDKFVQNHTSLNIWRQDSVQVAIDAGNNSSPWKLAGFDGDDYEFGLALTPKGAQSYCWKTALVNRKYKAGSLPKTLSVERLKNNTTIYKCYIPWDRLKPFTPRPGYAFKMSYIVNDADRDKTTSYCFELTPGVFGGKKPHYYKTFILVPEKQSTLVQKNKGGNRKKNK